MSNFHHGQYKKRPAGFTDTNNGRLIRAGRLEEHRRVNRAEHFARHRDISRGPVTEEFQPSRRLDPTIRLRRWKAERELKKKIEQQNKKPVFKVGVVHHNFYSPPISDRIKMKTQPCHSRGGHRVKHQPTPPKRITRATQKRLDAKKLASTLTPAVASTSKVSSTPGKSSRKRLPSTKKNLTRSFAPENYSFRAPSGITEIPLFGRIVIPKTSKVEQPSTSKTVELDLKIAEEKPWPTTKNQLVRQTAIERFSQEFSAPVSTRNSSIETICLRLSSEDESGEEPNVETQQTSDVSELVNAEVADAIEVDTSTPPRSGTPVPASFSPYIVTRRGKDSARKEQQTKMGIRRSSSNEIPTKDTVMQSLNISIEDEEQTAQYFKFLLQRETEKLMELCAKWEVIKTEPNLGEDAEYQINAAVGQTKLLIRKKFERFQSLINDCETGKGQMLVRCKDLQGFWDLMNREVKDCESRFLKLEFLRSNGWIEEETVVKKVAKKKAAPAKVKINAKSSARQWILAARMKKMSQDEDLNNDAIAAQKSVEAVPSTSGAKTKTPKDKERRRTTPTPKKTPTSLLKQVQLSEASKNIRSPLAVIKISKMCKTPDVTLDDTISYVNSDQTPGKGILKKSEESSERESCPPKSSRKVDFNDDVFLEHVPTDEIAEALQNSMDLGRVLARIDSYDSDIAESYNISENVIVRRVDKRLDFEDESFDETENTDTAESTTIAASVPDLPTIPKISFTRSTPVKVTTTSIPEPLTIPEINVVMSTPARVTNTPPRSNRRSSRRASIIPEVAVEEEYPINTRVLRNRMVTTETSTKSDRRSRRSSIADKTNCPSMNTSIKENNDPQRGTEKGSASDLYKVLGTEQNNEDHTKRRRSTRKSVRFNPDDCTACGEMAKPIHPMTPHTRRSRKVSLLGDSSSESVVPSTGGDLMSFDTPSKTPTRIRRSSCK